MYLRQKQMRNFILILVFSLIGAATLWAGTDGFHTYTFEGARRYAIEKQPRDLPDVVLQDQNGNQFALSSFQGKYILFTFFYIQCGDLCPVLEAQFKKVVAAIPESAKDKDITFLSISFDPEHDDSMALEHYAEELQVDGIHWQVVTIPDDKQLKEIMKVCGVVAIPNPQGGYEHNAAIYTADRQMRLTHIFDYNNTNFVIRKVNSLLEI